MIKFFTVIFTNSDLDFSLNSDFNAHKNIINPEHIHYLNETWNIHSAM